MSVKTETKPASQYSRYCDPSVEDRIVYLYLTTRESFYKKNLGIPEHILESVFGNAFIELRAVLTAIDWGREGKMHIKGIFLKLLKNKLHDELWRVAHKGPSVTCNSEILLKETEKERHEKSREEKLWLWDRVWQILCQMESQYLQH